MRWKFASGTRALGIFIDDEHCWVGNDSGKVFASDIFGRITVFNPEHELMWKKPKYTGAGWMVRNDPQGIYHGNGLGVAAYALETGKLLWRRNDISEVAFGWQTEKRVYAG